MITATLARQHGIKGPVMVVQVVDATLDTERHGAVVGSGGHVIFVQPLTMTTEPFYMGFTF